MESVLVVFENSEAGRRVADLLESGGTAKCQVCRSGDQARRLLNRQTVYCVVCSPHLSDGPAEWLCPDLPPVCSLLLVGPQHTLDACASRDVFKLPTPIRREEALSEMERDSVVMDVLGTHVSSHYISGKLREWLEYQTRVSSWELEKYLVIY